VLRLANRSSMEVSESSVQEICRRLEPGYQWQERKPGGLRGELSGSRDVWRCVYSRAVGRRLSKYALRTMYMSSSSSSSRYRRLGVLVTCITYKSKAPSVSGSEMGEVGRRIDGVHRCVLFDGAWKLRAAGPQGYRYTCRPGESKEERHG
jgi:hypothetical protein